MLHAAVHSLQSFDRHLDQVSFYVYPLFTESFYKYHELSIKKIHDSSLPHSILIRKKNLFLHSQFLAWLSEAESLCENTEAEIERNPLGVKVSEVLDFLFMIFL